MPFSVLAELGNGNLNPPIDIAYTNKRVDEVLRIFLPENIHTIFASPSQRCQDTAQLIVSALNKAQATTEVKSLPSLAEVHFDLYGLDRRFNVQKEMQKKGIVALNSGVFEGMVSGEHCESMGSICRRVQEIFSTLQNTSRGIALCITHDFLMRVIELSIKRVRSCESITVQQLEGTQRNGYLSGFATNAALDAFVPFE